MTDLLIKLATRERPQRAFDTILSFATMAEGEVRFIVSIDEDDETMNTPEATEQLTASGRGSTVRVCVGRSENKIEACNRDLEDERFDIVILAADDMRPVVHGYDRIIIDAMCEHFPNFDGALFFNDGNTGKKLNTLPIMGYNLYRKFGYIYHPSYQSLWADNEYQDVLWSLNRLPYFDQCVIEHCHPSRRKCATVPLQPDALLKREMALNDVDERNYNRRSAEHFGRPEILLSIGICTIHEREKQFVSLLDHLNDQINRHDSPLKIEILIERDRGTSPTGTKRNLILDRALGRFVVFIDDDDAVSVDYVSKIIAAIRDNPSADCVRVEGMMTTGGKDPKRFITSLSCGSYYTRNGVFYRTPNHITPVRTELARACRFPDVYFSEDSEYARRLMASGELKTEAPTDGVLYQYRYDPEKSTSTKKVRAKRKRR